MSKGKHPEGPTQHLGHEVAMEGATIIEAFQLGSDAGIISVGEYNGKKSLDLRRFYLGEDDGKWHPTAKGFKIPADKVAVVLDAIHDHHNLILQLLR